MKIIFQNRKRRLNHRRSPERQQKLPIVPVAIFGLSVLLSPQAAAVSVAAQGDPVKSGTGAALTGRWANVTAVGGASVDVFAEILSQSTTKTNDFWTDGDDMAFSFKDGVAGETREATVRYTFLDNATDMPVKVTGLSLTIDDLDDGGGRHESLSTSDATSYSLNNPTQVGGAISNSTITLTANGGNDLMPGDSEGAVRIDFAAASSFTITYQTTFSGATPSSAYHLDGDSDFTLSNPVSTPVHLQPRSFTSPTDSPMTITRSNLRRPKIMRRQPWSKGGISKWPSSTAFPMD